MGGLVAGLASLLFNALAGIVAGGIVVGVVSLAKRIRSPSQPA